MPLGSPGASDRKISFAVLGDRSDSIHSSTTSITGLDPMVPPHTPSEERKGKILLNCLKIDQPGSKIGNQNTNLF